MQRCRLAVAVLVGAFSVLPAWAAPQSEPKGSLKILSSGLLETAGSYHKDGSRVFFLGADDTKGRRAVQVMVNDIVLDAVEDQSAAKLRMDGHGLALTLPDRLALIALAEALADAWRSDAQLGQLPAHRDLLFRHILYWAEAPVGLPLRQLEISIPAEWESTDPSEGDPLDAIFEKSGGPKAESCKSYTTRCPIYRGNCETSWSLPCKQGDCSKGKTCFRCDNTRTYLSGCDYKKLSDICHDADGSGGHCFLCESLTAGCDKGSNCVGRCGPGCNPSLCFASRGKDGEGTYTYDCAEHDRCCGQHGGCLSGTGATHCGDEYAEAYDDTVYGKCTCAGCYAK